MRRSSGKVYKRGKQFWIDFTYNGKRYREAVAPDEDLALDVLAKRKVDIREGKFFPEKEKVPDPVRFHDFAKEYLKWSIANKKPSAKNRELSQMRILDRDFGEKCLHEITRFDIESWKMKRKKKVKPSTVNRELAVLKGFFSRAVEWGKVKNHPARGIKTFKGIKSRLRYLMPDEVRILLSNCAEHIKPIVIVAVHTGMRKSEVLGLRRDQVDFERGIITLTDTKNSERRDIPMNETVKATLRAIDGEEKTTFLKKGKSSAYYFASKIKKGSSYHWIDLSFHQALDKSKIEDFRFHDLRHTFASNLVMAGEDLNTVGELLGHKDPKTTRIYAHLSPAFKKKAVNVLDRIMSQNPPQEEKPEQKVVGLKS